ncbi:MAG: hypothetical protein CR988_08030 [Treponema sp.]|nr:MAG: hypothetical protein CR988_08030 [Treponema sp.]
MANYDNLEKLKKLRMVRRYPSSFKYACVGKALEQPDKSFKSLAMEIGISETSLWRWHDEYRRKELAIKAEKIPEMLNCEQLFWVFRVLKSFVISIVRISTRQNLSGI